MGMYAEPTKLNLTPEEYFREIASKAAGEVLWFIPKQPVNEAVAAYVGDDGRWVLGQPPWSE